MAWKRLVLGLGVFGAVSGVGAADTHWVCALSGEGTRLFCVADADDAPEPADSAASTRPTVVNGTRFPLDTTQTYTVDLWGPPTEVASVKLLAQATICYRSPGCSVTLAPGPWLAALRAERHGRFGTARRKAQ